MLPILSKEECRRNFAINCEKIRIEKDLSQKEMADVLGVSLSTYSKMLANTTQTITAYMVYKLSRYCNMPMSALFGDITEEMMMFHKFENMSTQQKRFIKAIIDYEYDYTQKKSKKTTEITLMCPNGDFYDGFDYDTCTYDKIDISDNYSRYKDSILCAIKLPNNTYSPTYVKNDILLIGNDRVPRNNEIGLFIYENKVYLRKLRIQGCIALEPIADIGRPFILTDSDFKKWKKFGYVIKKIRDI